MRYDLVIDSRMIRHSGIGTYLRNLLPAVVSHFHCAFLGDPEILGEFPWTPQTAIIPVTAPIYSPREQWELLRKIPPTRVFWSPHFNVSVLPVGGHKRLVTIHDVYHLAFAHAFSLPKRFYARFLIRQAVTLSHRIITVSKFSKQELTRLAGADETQISVIYNGIDHHHFKPLPPETCAVVQQKYKLPPHFFLFVGNIKPHKNLSRLVRAFAAIADQISDWHLVVIGKTEGLITTDAQVRQVVEAYPAVARRIHFLGEVPYEVLPHFYNLAGAFVFPSYYEGFGLPPLEAMACGCPVAAAQAASIPEVCGDAAHYFDPFSTSAIGEALITLATREDLRKTLIQRGLLQAKRFQWKESQQQTIAVIKALLTE